MRCDVISVCFFAFVLNLLSLFFNFAALLFLVWPGAIVITMRVSIRGLDAAPPLFSLSR